MSNGAGDSPITVEQDGVTVEKAFEPEEFPVPAMAFTLGSSLEEPVEIRLVDRIPDSFPMENVGFHPEYESEHWTAYEDHRVVYSRTLAPGEEVTTVYGVRLEDPERAEAFLTPPVLEREGDRSETVEEVLGGDDSQPIRDVLAGECSSLPGLDDPGDGESVGRDGDEAGVADLGLDEEPEEVDLGLEDDAGGEGRPDPDDGEPIDDPGLAEPAPTPRSIDDDLRPAVVGTSPDDGGPGTEPAAGTDDGSPADATDATGDPAPGTASASAGGSVAARLASEIRAGEVPEEELDALRDALGGGDVPRSVDVRISRLQSTVEDLGAYAEALEAFIDEHGTARGVLDDVQSRTDDLAEHVESLEGELEATASERAEIREEVEAVAEAVDAVRADLEREADRVETAEGELSDVRDDLAALGEEVDAVEERLEGEIGGLSDEVDDHRDRLEELETFRDRLGSAFGGPDGA